MWIADLWSRFRRWTFKVTVTEALAYASKRAVTVAVCDNRAISDHLLEPSACRSEVLRASNTSSGLFYRAHFEKMSAVIDTLYLQFVSDRASVCVELFAILHADGAAFGLWDHCRGVHLLLCIFLGTHLRCFSRSSR